MSKGCTHIAGIQNVTPSALGCEECLKSGSRWLHLRICRSCGHVGCCDDSPNKHATAHFHATAHPVVEGYDPRAGAMSTTCCSTCLAERLPTTGKSRATTRFNFSLCRSAVKKTR
jgi:hypothetical protein